MESKLPLAHDWLCHCDGDDIGVNIMSLSFRTQMTLDTVRSTGL